jgi:hypothetical protein
MTDSRSARIDELYPVALAEGEGVGTAYEYVAKARFLRPVTAHLHRGSRALVAGLPERYGTSLDFVLLANEAGASVLVVDERQDALDRARRAVDSIQRDGRLAELAVAYRRLQSLDDLGVVGPHDVVLSCEVLQRVDPLRRGAFAATLRALAPAGAVFVPNGDNASHVTISGLTGISLDELRALVGGGQGGRVAYVDMPPFPPGITRSPDQRARAATGTAERIAMRGLDLFCAAERFVPAALKRRLAHIACVSWAPV